MIAKLIKKGTATLNFESVNCSPLLFFCSRKEKIAWRKRIAKKFLL